MLGTFFMWVIFFPRSTLFSSTFTQEKPYVCDHLSNIGTLEVITDYRYKFWAGVSLAEQMHVLALVNGILRRIQSKMVSSFLFIFLLYGSSGYLYIFFHCWWLFRTIRLNCESYFGSSTFLFGNCQILIWLFLQDFVFTRPLFLRVFQQQKYHIGSEVMDYLYWCEGDHPSISEGGVAICENPDDHRAVLLLCRLSYN